MDGVAALSNKGRRRKKNEDSILSVPLRGGMHLIAVADGVGGERAGEVASAGVTKLLSEQLTSLDVQHADEELSMAIQAANHSLWERSRNDVRLQGMATTLVAAILSDGTAWLANVGDSRAYLIEGDTITQISQDHSLVAERVREGDLTEEEARQSHARHIITRSIASDSSIEVDTFGPITLPPDSRLLLCSDGLHDVVEGKEIARIASSAPADEAAKQLIDTANELGGPDNISVVIYQAPGTAGGGAATGGKRRSSAEPLNRYALAGITAGIIILVGAIALGAGILVGEGSDDEDPAAVVVVPTEDDDPADEAEPTEEPQATSSGPSAADRTSAAEAQAQSTEVVREAQTETAIALADAPTRSAVATANPCVVDAATAEAQTEEPSDPGTPDPDAGATSTPCPEPTSEADSE